MTQINKQITDELPSELRKILPNDLKDCNFVKTKSCYWYGVCHTGQGDRVFIKHHNGKWQINVKRDELEETCQFSAGIWIQGLKKLFKRK